MHPNLKSPDAPTAGMDSPTLIAAQDATVVGRQSTAERVGEVLRVLRRKARYIARFAYYAAVHGGFKHVRWALAHEGTQW